MFNPFKTSTKSFPIDRTNRSTIVASNRKAFRHLGSIRQTSIALSETKDSWLVTKKSIFAL